MPHTIDGASQPWIGLKKFSVESPEADVMRLALVNRCKQDHTNCLVRQDDYKVPGLIIYRQ